MGDCAFAKARAAGKSAIEAGYARAKADADHRPQPFSRTQGLEK